MSDPFLALGRLFTLVFVPVMLLFPLLFALLVPNRASDDAARLRARTALLTLGLCTLVLLGLFAGLLVCSVRFTWAGSLAGFWWVCFFPLWFGLAMPAVLAKNPAWGRTPGSCEESTRTALLLNRERTSPIGRAMWLLPTLVVLGATGAIAARGLAPFPMRIHGADGSTVGAFERTRWILSLAVYASVFGLSLAILPRSVRRTLTEPEPMDVRGSEELAELYSDQRRRRVLGLFWGGGVVLPAFIGTVISLSVWFPYEGSLWGLVGGLGGAAIGVAGAIFGTRMSVERSRISEARAKFNQRTPFAGPV